MKTIDAKRRRPHAQTHPTQAVGIDHTTLHHPMTRKSPGIPPDSVIATSTRRRTFRPTPGKLSSPAFRWPVATPTHAQRTHESAHDRHCNPTPGRMLTHLRGDTNNLRQVARAPVTDGVLDVNATSLLHRRDHFQHGVAGAGACGTQPNTGHPRSMHDG